MDILFVTNRTAFQNKGGGEVQVREIRRELKSRGHTVDLFSPAETVISEYDILHAFSTKPDMLSVVCKAKQSNVPIVLSPIYINPVPEMIETSDIANLSKYLVKRLTVRSGVNALDPVAKLCNMADILLPNSRAEASLLSKRYSVPHESMVVIPNGVETRFMSGDPSQFRDKYNIDDFVLFVCTPSPIKNLHRALPALELIDETAVVIGPSESSYAKSVQSKAPSARFLGKFPHDSDLLESAYSAASAFALPSLYETAGIAALEAGASGTNVAVTKRGGTSEYVGEFAEVVDPKNSEEILNGICKALTAGGTRAEKLQKHIHDQYTWEKIGHATIKSYQRVRKIK